MTFRFKRKGSLISDKIRKKKSIGYARAINSEIYYLEEQISSLENEGCNIVFSEILNLLIIYFTSLAG